MPVGVLGILLGAIFAAAMSTLSSSLNSCATAAANDLLFPAMGRKLSAGHELWVIRVLTAVFGLAQIGVGIAGQWLQEAPGSLFIPMGLCSYVVAAVRAAASEPDAAQGRT